MAQPLQAFAGLQHTSEEFEGQGLPCFRSQLNGGMEAPNERAVD
jgi:hypothetical protein